MHPSGSKLGRRRAPARRANSRADERVRLVPRPPGDGPARRAAGSARRTAEAEVLAFLSLLRAVEHGVRSVSKGLRPRLGVTGSELLVLRMAGKYPGLSAGDLARLLHVNASSLTGVLERLAQRRLLARHTDPLDRRRDVLHLTASGRRVDRQRAGTVEARIQRALGRLSRAQIQSATLVLETLASELSTR